ncbi:MAG: helix-turn-helix domain-containing protein [Gemmatimonadota bacterium]|nr:helix-turn-helix domain-containing protein [Gemmatimonadota bacterium]
MESWIEPKVPGLGETQRRLLAALKRKGKASIPELAALFDLAAGTLREHLNALSARGLVERAGARREGPGRPEILYGLTERGDGLFPRGEAELLTEFVRHLLDAGREDVLERFFEARVESRRADAEARTRGLEGAALRDAVAQIFTEAGFLAEVEEDADGAPVLRLGHCPLRTVVDHTQLPCRAELRLLGDLLGGRLERVQHIPDGDPACAYRILPPEPGEETAPRRKKKGGRKKKRGG